MVGLRIGEKVDKKQKRSLNIESRGWGMGGVPLVAVQIQNSFSCQLNHIQDSILQGE